MPLKILHVISTLDPRDGGPVSALEGLAAAQARLPSNVEIFASYRRNEDESVVERLAQSGIQATRIGPVRSPLGLHSKLKETAFNVVKKSDIVHLHGVWEDIHHRVARAAQELKKPYIIRPCGMLDPWSLSQSRFRKQMYLLFRLKRNLNRAASVHFTAQLEHELTAPLDIKAPAIIEPNGLEIDEFENLPAIGSSCKVIPEIEGRPYVLFLSRIHSKKGLNLLLPAFSKAAPNDCCLVVAGPGEREYVDEIRRLGEKHGISDRLIFPGMITGRDKLSVYRDADLFCLPSYQENFGNVIIESLACGTPVLISNRVNIYKEIVQAGVGRSVEPTVEQLTQCLTSYLDELAETPVADATRMAARNFALNGYSWSSIARSWLEHYQRLVQV